MNTKLRSFLFVLLAMGIAGFTFSRRATTEPLLSAVISVDGVADLERGS